MPGGSKGPTVFYRPVPAGIRARADIIRLTPLSACEKGRRGGPDRPACTQPQAVTATGSVCSATSAA